MKRSIRTGILTGILAIGAGTIGVSSVKAHDPILGGGYGYGGGYGGGYDGGSYGGGYGSPGGYSSYGGGSNGYGGYGGGYGGYGVPSYSYYGNGGHDTVPHTHTTQTPIGSFNWYGAGAHDYQPHGHTQTPYGVQSYSGGPFTRTTSYASPTPYIYRPW